LSTVGVTPEGLFEMHARHFSNKLTLLSVVFAALLTVCFQSAASAQATDGSGGSTVYEEHHRVSGWEEPLCSRDGNLRHYYWTDVDVSSRYRTNAINRVAPRANPYHVISRVAGPNSKPVAIPPMSAKARSIGDNRMASSDCSGVLRSKAGSGARANRNTSTFTYASYSYNPSSKPVAQYESSSVKGRVLSY